MWPTILSYNGFPLRNSRFSASFPRGTAGFLQSTASLLSSERSGDWPYPRTKNLHTKQFQIQVDIKRMMQADLDELNKIFSVDDSILHPLLVIDTGTKREWFLNCSTIAQSDLDGHLVTYTMEAPTPIWESNDLRTSSKSITTTGETLALSVEGNHEALPILTLTPSTVGSGRYTYARWLTLYNPSLTVPFDSLPFDVTNGGWDTSGLYRDASNNALLNSLTGIDDSVTTIPYDTVTGTLPTSGVVVIDDEQISYTGKTVTDLTGCTRGINGTTAATHADDEPIYLSHLMANGYDIDLQINGGSVNRWISGVGTSATRVWANVSFSPGVQMILGTAVDDNDLELVMKNTTANVNALKKLPATGQLYIGTERVTYSSVTPSTRKIVLTERGARNTTAAAHSIGATVIWIQHDFSLRYGNTSAEDPEIDDDFKPIFDLSSSTNTSWVYTEFFSYLEPLRTGAWTRTLNATGIDSRLYTTTELGDETDPATIMGIHAIVWYGAGLLKSETVNAYLQLYHPAGITHAAADGKKYRSLSRWATLCGLYRRASTAVGWTAVWTEATPTTAATWTACNHTATSLGAAYKYLAFRLSASLTASIVSGVLNEVDYEVDNVTLTINSATLPQVVVGTQLDACDIQARITNTLTGDWIAISLPLKVNSVLTIDTSQKTVYLQDGSNMIRGLSKDNEGRYQWLPLTPGETNTLQYDDAGTGTVALNVSWRDRMKA